MSWYNEIDPAKAEWLRQLMARGVIEQGTVDERSITEIKPHELEADTCHFFAGIGIWQYALQLAGWTGPVWTGSCPCQPFSVAGQRKGQADERHLWPAWFRLITERRPITIFGEQVADGDGQAWLDNVQADLEPVGYRIGSLTLPAASVGAPHGRHRTFFVADTELRAAERQRFTVGETQAGEQRETHQRQRIRADPRNGGENGSMADAGSAGRNGRRKREAMLSPGQEQRPERFRNAGELGNADEARSQGRELLRTTGSGNGGNRQTPGTGGASGDVEHSAGNGRESDMGNSEKREGSALNRQSIQSNGRAGPNRGPSAVNGFWADAEWIPCRGKIPGTTDWRPIKPGSLALADGASSDLLPLCDYGFPLVKGAEARSLRLKGYGDGIVVRVAVEFIKAYMSLK